MRTLIALSPPAMLVMITALVLVIHFELNVFGLALILGPALFLMDILDGEGPSRRKGFQALAGALALFPIGLLVSYWTATPFIDVLNKTDSYILRRLLALPVAFALLGLLELLATLVVGDNRGETDASQETHDK